MDETQALIVACVRAGKPLTEAAREAGTSINNIKRWLTHGRHEPDSQWAEFARAVDAAKVTVPGTVAGDRFAEIEAVAVEIGQGAAGDSALLGLARALARKIDWCEATPTGAAAMALANLSKQYREVLAEVAPPNKGDMDWLRSLMVSPDEQHYEEALERIAKGEMTADEAAADAAATLGRASGARALRAERGGVFAQAGDFENLEGEASREWR